LVWAASGRRGLSIRSISSSRNTVFASKLACMVCISAIRGDAEGLVCPNGQTVPPSAGYLITPSNQGFGFRFGPTSSGPFTPATLRGPAAIRHPWRGAALAASMPLGPLRIACVQPAPKSRFVVSGLLRYEDQDQKRSALCAFVASPNNLPAEHKTCGSQLGVGRIRTNAVCHSPLMKLAHSQRKHANGSHAPRGNRVNDALRHPGCGAGCQLCDPQGTD
jgi:hypothetical protein